MITMSPSSFFQRFYLTLKIVLKTSDTEGSKIEMSQKQKSFLRTITKTVVLKKGERANCMRISKMIRVSELFFSDM